MAGMNWQIAPMTSAHLEAALNRSDFDICWSDRLSFGDPDMDHDVQQIIVQVNALNRAVIACEGKATVRALIERMWIQVVNHFWREQQLLARWQYPDRALHAGMHIGLATAYDRLMKEFEDADLSFVWALKALRIERLWLEHIRDEDMKYREFLCGKAGDTVNRRYGRSNRQKPIRTHFSVT